MGSAPGEKNVQQPARAKTQLQELLPRSKRVAAELIKIDFAHPEKAFSRCKDVVASGGVIAYPTDTFYGLGVDPKNLAAVTRLFAIKGRQGGQAILLLIEDASQVREWAADVTPRAERLMKTHWPGPLTLVFRAQAHVLPELTAGTGTIGLRVPGSPLTRQLLEFLGTALTGTSANISGGPGSRSAEEAMKAVGGMIDLVLDGGPTPGGRPSTVVDAGTGRVIRKGAVKV